MAEFHVHQREDAIYKIYKLTAPTGKVYIGCTRLEPENRWMNGYGYRKQPFFFADIEKFGWDAFEKEILCDKLLQEAAEKLEDKFIQYYDSRNPEKGYNCFTGGARKGAQMSALGQQHCSESIYELWSHPEYKKRQKAERRRRYAGNPEMCKKTSEATKAALTAEKRRKMSEAKRSYYASGNKPQTKPRACQCLESGKTYISFMAAERDTGASHSHISQCCKGQQLTAGGYHWRYADRENAAEN